MTITTLCTLFGQNMANGTPRDRCCLRSVRCCVRLGIAGHWIDVPASCLVFKLPEETRRERNLVVSDILIRDDYRQALDDICNFATNKGLPPPLHDFSSGDFENPFLDKQSSMVGAVMLLGHPGIGKQGTVQCLSFLILVRQKPLAAFRACTPYPRRTSNYLPL